LDILATVDAGFQPEGGQRKSSYGRTPRRILLQLGRVLGPLSRKRQYLRDVRASVKYFTLFPGNDNTRHGSRSRHGADFGHARCAGGWRLTAK
jgi:hypothetical protein